MKIICARPRECVIVHGTHLIYSNNMASLECRRNTSPWPWPPSCSWPWPRRLRSRRPALKAINRLSESAYSDPPRSRVNRPTTKDNEVRGRPRENLKEHYPRNWTLICEHGTPALGLGPLIFLELGIKPNFGPSEASNARRRGLCRLAAKLRCVVSSNHAL